METGYKMDYALLVIDYYTGLIECGNTPDEAKLWANKFMNRFYNAMGEVNAKHTADLLDRLAAITK